MKYRLIILAILLLSIGQTVWAYDFSYTYLGQTLYYTITNSSQRTVKVVNPMSGNYSSYVTGDLVIPQNVYNGYTYRVTNIGERAFSNCSGLTSVSIPNSVTQIDKYAFYQCGNMTSVSIGNGVTRIDNYAFQGCSRLDSLTIPNGVSEIGWLSFGGCSGLTSLTIGTGVTVINIKAFMGCDNLTSVTFNAINCICAGNPGRPTDYTERAFVNCPNITNFTFGDNVELIPAFLCYGMSNLTSITIPNSVTTIGNMAFYNCGGLTSIAIGNSVSNIGGSAFSRCNGVTSIVVSTGNTHYDSRGNCNAIIQTDLNILLYGCQTTIIPNTVTTIGNSAFSQCINLTSITVPNSVTSIESSAFQNCTGLSSVTIPNSVINIGEQSFYACSGLTSVTIGNSVTVIGDYAFYNCSNLSSVTIPNSVTIIGNGAFNHCGGLTSIHIPGSVDSIGQAAFDSNIDSISVDVDNMHYDSRNNCNAIIETASNKLINGCQNTTIPYGITSIGSYAFSSCSGLTSIIIPSSVTTIGDEAFSGCSGLTSIIIPDSVTLIGKRAFANCDFDSVVLGKSITSLGYQVFYCYGCYAVRDLYCKATIPPNINSPYLNAPWRFFVPCNAVQDYQNTSGWNTYPSRIYGKNYWEYTYGFTANNDSMGVVSFGEPDCDSNIVVTATVLDGNSYHFIEWSDGGTINPRTFHLTGDTSMTAFFDYIPYTVIGISNDTVQGFVASIDSIHYGDTVTLTATANYGYHFTQWSDGNTDNPRHIQVTRDSVFTAQFDYNQYGIALSVDTTIHGSVSGAGSYNYLSERSITATANYGYRFTQWSDGDTNNPRTLTLTQDTAFTALFAKNTYSITALSADTVKGYAGGTGTLEYLDTAILTATANYGYHFTQWNDGNTANPRLVQVTRDSIFTAQFDYNQYSIVLAVDTTIHGFVSGAGNYNYLSERAISATPNYGYHFTQWSDGNTDNPRTLMLTQDTVFTAQFTKNTYNIVALSADTVKGFAVGSDTLEYLDTATLTATANYGYHFTQWSDGITDNPRQVQVTRDSVFMAQFDYNQYSITLDVDSTIHGMVNGAGSYNYLSSRTISATANYGYHFATWSDGVTDNPRTLTLTKDTSLMALFSISDYNILATSANSTMGTASVGAGQMDYLDTITLTATPNYGYHFTQWSDGDTNNPRLVQVTRDSVFTAQFDYNQYGIALSVDTTIHGSVSGEGSYNYLSERTLTATANYGYHFTMWNDGDTNNPRTLTLTQDTVLTALFAENIYSITTLSADTMKGYTVGTGTLEYLDTATITATANYGYHFTQWSDGNTDNPRMVQVTCDSVFTAQFDYNQYSIALAVDTTIHGTVSGAGNYNYLSERTISATPNYGYHFTMWNDGDTNNPRTLTLTQDTAFTALFENNSYEITTLSADTAMGTADKMPATQVYLGTVTLIATANYGYHFTQWNDGNTDNPRTVQVTRDSVFTAQFDYNQYGIALSVDTTIHGSVSGAGNYNYLSERSITATANYGYHFTQWSDGDTDNPRTLTLTQDTAFTALFAKNTYSITALSADTVKGYAGGTGTLEYLDTATLTATANYGYHFTQWSDGNTANPRLVQVTRDSVFTAQFDYNQYSIALAVDTTIHGTVSGTGSYNYLSERTINATPNYGYHFTMWSDGDTNNPRTLTLTQDTVFTALFAKNTYNITALSADTTKGFAVGTDVLEYLDTATLTATANYGYHFTQWSDGVTDNPRLVQVTRDSVFTAQFDYNQYSIALAVDTTVHGTVSGAGSYNYLSERTINATPNYGYHFTMWSDGDTNNPRTLTLTQDTAFTALFAKNTYSIVALSADTVKGYVVGTGTLEYLDIATLTATANYGYHFMQWSDGNTDNPRQVQVTRDSVFTAQFDYNLYSIALAVDTTIHGSVSGAGNYNYLSERAISATPNYGYHFTMWSDGDTNNPRTFTLTQDTAFTAQFANNTYSIVALSADTMKGTVTGTDSLEYLDTATLTATANYGYHFMQWSDGVTDNPRLVQVTRDSVFTAQFDYNQYSITLAVDTAIHGTVSGAGDYNYLSSRTISATANYGYHFTMWNDGDTNNPRTLTLTQDTTFTALFVKNQYIVTLSVNDTTLGTVTGDGTYNYLDTVTMTAICTAEHHHFVQWNDGITDVSRSIIIVCDTAYTAIFAIDTHSVTLAVNDDLLGSVNGMGNYPYGTQVTIEATANDGYHFAEWSNGSRENPLVITLESDTTVTAIFTDDVVPQICMITVQDGRNMVMWDKELEVQAYNIYREGITAGEYDLVASVPYDSLSVWVDTASRPRTRSYRYRMTATDIFGIESEPSEIHKTMHLYINQGLGNECNLVWSEYEGADYSTYVIYRGTDANNIHQIDVMAAGGNTTYTDENPPAGEVYYQVGILLNTPCNPSKSSTIVRSNIAIRETVGIPEIEDMDNNICIYTENGCIYVSRDGQTVNDFHVYDVVGREVYHARQETHTSILPEGVYLVKVGIYPARKVVVIR